MINFRLIINKRTYYVKNTMLEFARQVRSVSLLSKGIDYDARVSGIVTSILPSWRAPGPCNFFEIGGMKWLK